MKSDVEGSSQLWPDSEVILCFLASKCWKLHKKCVVEGRMQMLLLEANLGSVSACEVLVSGEFVCESARFG